MDLYVIRHAWAGHFGDPEWPDDSQRPLSPEGKQRFAHMVKILADRGFRPQILATSPMVRCRQTADLVVEGVSGEAEVVELNDLLPGGDLESLLRWTAQQAQQFDQIAWVGHAPHVGQLTAGLIGAADSWIRFAKGAVAAVRFDEEVQAGDGELRWLASAKLLGC